MKARVLLLLGLMAPTGLAADLKVAVLHPLLGDLARQVGGDQVEVVDLIGADGDPHKFEPGPQELQQARGAQLYLASGKGLESYLEKLKGIVGEERVFEVGAGLPTLTATSLCEHHDHAPAEDGNEEGEEHHHHHEVDDPHWWHSLDCWGRAARVVAKRLGELDPDNAEDYRKRAGEARRNFATLNRWAERELAKVPAERRVLATAHAAFAYFCHDYGWRMLPVQGLNREQVASPRFVGEVARVIKEEKVAALFPEMQSNPKMLQTLSEQLGVRIGKPLNAAGGASIEEMIRHNVTTIVATLAEPVAAAP